jgi:hypothetical protein
MGVPSLRRIEPSFAPARNCAAASSRVSFVGAAISPLRTFVVASARHAFASESLSNVRQMRFCSRFDQTPAW